MIVMIKQKQPILTISILETIAYQQGGCMITIGKIPKKVQTFFKPTRNALSAHVYTCYCNLVMATCISHGSTIQRLVNLLRNSTHRTNHGEFLWRSEFDEMAVVGTQANAALKKLYKKGSKHCMRIIDDTQTIKRAKKMQAVGKIHHHATGKYPNGHTILKACLFYRGVTIPLGSWLYIKKEHAKEMDIPFKRRNDKTVIALVTNNICLSIEKVVSRYLKRWAIEVMIKEQKQLLGLGDYRVWRYRAIVRHLCLVDSAYACLTHVGIDDPRAQGDKKDTKDMLSLPSISQLKARMHQIIWRQEVQNVIKVSHDKKVIRRLEKLLAA